MSLNRAEKFIQDFVVSVPAGNQTDIYEIIVPPKAVMRILEIGLICRTATAWGTVHWQFFHDDLPLFPFQDIYDQPGYGTQRQAVKNVDIHGGHRLRIVGVNPTASAVIMGISLCYEFEYQE